MLKWKAGILVLPNLLSSCVCHSVSNDLSYTPERCLFGIFWTASPRFLSISIPVWVQPRFGIGREGESGKRASCVHYSVHGISQARILEWAAFSFSRGSSRPKNQTCVSCNGRWIIYRWATREAQELFQLPFNLDMNQPDLALDSTGLRAQSQQACLRCQQQVASSGHLHFWLASYKSRSFSNSDPRVH